MTVAIISAGYDGTVDEVQFAKLLHRYSVVGADDFKATTQAGDRIVALGNGTALGPGTLDVATGLSPIQFAAATGTRWDLVVLRRDWQPPGGASSIVIIQGGASKGFPTVGTAATNWNRRPGIIDDQPLYLQEVNGTLLGQRVDLRCWASHGGLFAKDDLVRSYLDAVGTRILINGVDWVRRLGLNDMVEWSRRSLDGEQLLVKSSNGVATVTTNSGGYSTITYPTPFPNATASFVVMEADDTMGSVTLKSFSSNPSAINFRAFASTGATINNTPIKVTWIATGY